MLEDSETSDNDCAKHTSWDAGLADRDYASLLLPDLDYDAQLRAIGDLLKQHDDIRQVTGEAITKVEDFARTHRGIRNEQAIEEWLDRMHNSVYQDAAHSMAAVGMLAPLVESLFYQAFMSTREYLAGTPPHPENHARWQKASRDAWDCHYVWTGRSRSKGIVEGIIQMAEAVGLIGRLPSDLPLKLKALFLYRHKMFHCGFEWPPEERREFAEHVRKDWPADWFGVSMSNGQPWIFYMTDSFVKDWLVTLDKVLSALGAFARDDLPRRN
jgi:hypothetical protein